ncbi:ATP-dependent DNA helicase [Cutibacterium acnes JCM 18920]|nr:ATP-dependent DNA helicase [Cutibacterium acnes JCM 18920]
MEQGKRADEIASSILKESGYITELENSKDPQDETRLENLIELVSVAQEFVARVHAVDIDEAEQATSKTLNCPATTLCRPSWSRSPWWPIPIRYQPTPMESSPS